jgi:N-acetylmuramoyl-L-alanine amidase
LTRKSLSGPKQTVGFIVLAFLLGVAYVVWMASGAPDGNSSTASSATGSTDSQRPTRTPRPSRTPRPTSTPRPSPTPKISPTPSPTPSPWKVGVVAGHWKNDSGAVCDDGLQEVTINLDVASRVVAILQHEGFDAELLPEFSEKLAGYEADAFISIHVDSCNVPEASGFKVARVAASAIPELEDRLVACLIQEYARATGLSYHKNSITYDMTLYHAFNEIDPETPGAIIELGFMAADREMLTDNSYRLAQGVARGIACFLEGP